MSKFKVGDKVRVLPRLEGQSNTYPYYSDEMIEFAGKESVIREKFRGGEWFELDNSEYTWHEEWLELVDKPFTQTKLLKEITTEELAKLGYTLKGEN